MRRGGGRVGGVRGGVALDARYVGSPRVARSRRRGQRRTAGGPRATLRATLHRLAPAALSSPSFPLVLCPSLHPRTLLPNPLRQTCNASSAHWSSSTLSSEHSSHSHTAKSPKSFAFARLYFPLLLFLSHAHEDTASGASDGGDNAREEGREGEETVDGRAHPSPPRSHPKLPPSTQWASYPASPPSSHSHSHFHSHSAGRRCQRSTRCTRLSTRCSGAHLPPCTPPPRAGRTPLPRPPLPPLTRAGASVAVRPEGVGD
jgi:hypothetical protein